MSETGSTPKQTKPEQTKDTTWLIYLEPGEYSVQYPSHWKFWRYQGGGKGLDFNFVELKKHDSTLCKNETCGWCPNSAYVSLSVRPKNSKSMEEIVNQSKLYDEVWEFREEKLEKDGYPCVKLHMIVDGYPATHLFIDCGEDRYASLYSSYSGGKDTTLMKNDIYKIQESFKILK